MRRALFQLPVALILLSFTAHSVLADTANGEVRKKGFFESLFGPSTPRKKRPPGAFFPWGRNSDNNVRILYGSGSNDPANQGSNYDDPEPIPGLGMGNPNYIPPKLALLADPAFSKLTAGDAQSQAILAQLSSLKTTLRAPQDERQPILDLYKSTGFKPVWLTAGVVSERAKALLAFAAKTSEDGLDPGAYLPVGLTSFDNVQDQLDGDAQKLAQFDVAMTASALKMARQISGGQFDPNRLSLYNDIKPERVDASQALKVLAWSPFPDAYLHDLAPKHPAYAIMKTELAKLRAAKTGPSYAKIANGKTVKLGGTDPRMPALRERLLAMGFLTAADNTSDAAQTNKLDAALSGALKKFQASVQIKSNGILGPDTIKNLNRDDTEENIQRLVDNMERLRWLPKDLGKRFVLVNQPAFEVHVMDHGNEIWHSEVIVGRPMSQTVAFHDEIETVVFNPSWGVPQSIIVNEYLKKLRNDPSYLDRQGFKVVNQQGKVVSSSSVDWGAYGSRPPFGVQQPPGKGNALGELKFLFPNKHDIYMHDTPTQNLFAETSRAFSHGCIRVQNPREFAAVLLRWDAAKIARETDSGVSQSVPLSTKIPVHITYFTAWPDASGKLVYFNDIYGRDKAMEKAQAETAALQDSLLAQKLVQN